MVRYNNPTGEDYDGGPCDLLKGNLCEYFFMFCIRDINATSACWHMAQSSPSVEANSYIFNQTGPLYTGANINNPISFTSNQAWPVSKNSDHDLCKIYKHARLEMYLLF